MKKFEYYTLYCYVNKNNEWVIDYLGEELSYSEFFNPILHKLGIEGWELVSNSTSISGNVVNRALIPITVEGDVGISNTTAENFYFKREIKENIEIRNPIFKKSLDYLEDIENTILNEEKAFSVFKENFEKVFEDNYFEKIESEKENIDYTYFKTVTENITKKKMFGNNEEKEQISHYKIEAVFDSNENVKISILKKTEGDDYWWNADNASFKTIQSEIESINNFIKI